MAITYPLSLPTAPGFTNTEFNPVTLVGAARSPFTFESQILVWPGAAWSVRASLPPMTVAQADAWVGFFLSLNGKEGTFLLGDKTRPTTRGTAAGSKTVGSGATVMSTTLPIAGGTGDLAVGDWLQITNHLYKVAQFNSSASVDVWPRLRSSYASGTAITYVSAKGLFRLADNEMRFSINALKHYGMELNAVEAI